MVMKDVTTSRGEAPSQALWGVGSWLTPQTEMHEDQVQLAKKANAADVDRFSIISGSERHRSCYVMGSKNRFRQLFNGLLAIFLIHTGTVMPYRLCFADFHMPEPITPSPEQRVLEWIVEIFWLFDLVINFFFGYTDDKGEEVLDGRMVAVHYLQGIFIPNLIACTPEFVVGFVIRLFGSTGKGEMNKIVRLFRLQRMSRLARLMRLTAVLEYMDQIFGRNNRTWRALKGSRAARIANFMFGLLWIVHIVGCGWYLCAALHEDPETTWVTRRTDMLGTPLIDKGPFDQWVHSCYFVLTVFTTCGFGDISAMTLGEIAYVSVTMLLGAVVNGIIVSDSIAMITSIDEEQFLAQRRKDLLDHFAKHTHLTEATQEWLSKKVTYNMEPANRYDKTELRDLLINGSIPRAVMEELPFELFGGELLRNAFVRICLSKASYLPPRFPILMATCLVEHTYVLGDIVYSIFDHPFNVFLVWRGTFAYVDRPEPSSCDDIGYMPTAGTTDGGVENPFLLGAAVPGLAFPGASLMGSLTRPPPLRKGKTKGLIEKSPTVLDRAAKDRFRGFRPVQLFSFGSYFGDIEILNVSPRLSTARCETQEGCVLMISKKDIDTLMQEFPHLTAAWKVSAYRRRGMHEAVVARSRSRVNDNYKHLAASIIQERYRKVKVPTARRESGSGGSPTEDACRRITTVASENGPMSPAFLSTPHHLPSFMEPTNEQHKTLTVEAVEWSWRDIHKMRTEMQMALTYIQTSQDAQQKYLVESIQELRSDLGLQPSRLIVTLDV